MVAGPDTTASLSQRGAEPFAGLRFRPGTLPRLLGVPAAELRDQRVALDELRQVRPQPPADRGRHRSCGDPATTRDDAVVGANAAPRHRADCPQAPPSPTWHDEIGWSGRTLQRQCGAVYGYGPATLRRILRFRRAVAMLRTGRRTSRGRGGGQVFRPAAPASRGTCARGHRGRRSGGRLGQRREQVDRGAVGVLDRGVALPPRRVERRQLAGMAHCGESLEHRVHVARGIESERDGHPPRLSGGVHPGCIPAITSSVSNASLLPPGSATSTCGPSGSGTFRPRAR